mgnify:CR=1 FL=1
MDIEGRKFRRAFRGYSARDVDEFRQEVIDNFEELLIENSKLKEQVERLDTEVKHYRSIEQNMNASLILAQRAADDVRSSAHHEAEAIIRDARTQTQEMIRDARRERAAIEKTTAQLEAQRDEFIGQFRAFLQAHLCRLDSYLTPAATPAAAAGPMAEQGGDTGAPIDPPPTSDAGDAEDGTGAVLEEDATGNAGEPASPPRWLMAVGDA